MADPLTGLLLRRSHGLGTDARALRQAHNLQDPFAWPPLPQKNPTWQPMSKCCMMQAPLMIYGGSRFDNRSDLP